MVAGCRRHKPIPFHVAADAGETATLTDGARASCLRLASQTTGETFHDKPAPGSERTPDRECLTLHHAVSNSMIQAPCRLAGLTAGERNDTTAWAARICSAHPCAMTAGARRTEQTTTLASSATRANAAAKHGGYGQRPALPHSNPQDNAGVANTGQQHLCEQPLISLSRTVNYLRGLVAAEVIRTSQGASGRMTDGVTRWSPHPLYWRKAENILGPPSSRPGDRGEEVQQEAAGQNEL
jgi:hypothetical protein